MNPIYCILLPLSITTPIFTVPVRHNLFLGKYIMDMDFNRRLLSEFIVNDFWVMLASLFGAYAIVLISTDSFKSKIETRISVSLEEKPESDLSKSELESESSTDYDSESDPNDSLPLYTFKNNFNKGDILMIALCWMMVLMFSFTLPILSKWSLIFDLKGFVPAILKVFVALMSEMKGILCLYALLCVPIY
ncbi:hypothetical protein BB559_000487 [Furculomyces boomerangus]|uniref:Uncharacterized protein n=1 Tax=Furculomyces boomerangus TaxID=61424 RepID=A0A2T9Z564_9FUNG|nr:hypothetical protein BB559_004676 [Furculomyces boomerangus]PVU99686.1 hypothetical protein BB559_000487 [Furculomyces boomerangus]